MDKLSKKEWVAVGVSVVFVAYVMFGGTITSFFMNGLGGNEAAVGSIGGDYSDNLNGMGNETDAGGVATQDLVSGTGQVIQPGQAVSVHYVLSLTDGTLIQDSKLVSGGQPFTFVYGAGQLIPGWEIGIQGMRIGGKRILTIPPELGYGAQAAGSIPPNSTLVFEIEVVDAQSIPTE